MANLIIDSKTEIAISKLREEAAQAGDLEQVRLCESALGGSRRAIARCIAVIANAQAQE